VGNEVVVAAVGDAVSLSFASCADCKACIDSHPAYCYNFATANFGGEIAYRRTGGEGLPGYFFGQSSFASFSNVVESSVVNISKLVNNVHDMYNHAALGCSLQSGSSTVVRLIDLGKEDSVVVMGLGAVGLSAIMVCYALIYLHSFKNTLDRITNNFTARLLKFRDVPVLLPSTALKQDLNSHKSWELPM
jgi:Zn-dependent alcohol dehydrogenase